MDGLGLSLVFSDAELAIGFVLITISLLLVFAAYRSRRTALIRAAALVELEGEVVDGGDLNIWVVQC